MSKDKLEFFFLFSVKLYLSDAGRNCCTITNGDKTKSRPVSLFAVSPTAISGTAIKQNQDPSLFSLFRRLRSLARALGRNIASLRSGVCTTCSHLLTVVFITRASAHLHGPQAVGMKQVPVGWNRPLFLSLFSSFDQFVQCLPDRDIMPQHQLFAYIYIYIYIYI